MKKALGLLLALALLMSLAACGGGDSTEPDQDDTGEAGDTGEVSEVPFVPMTFGYITISLPDVFGSPTEQDGMYVSPGPNAAIVATPVLELDMQPSEWTESLLEESLEAIHGSQYENPELAAFQGDVNMNGNSAVYYAFYGKESDGTERLVHVVILYNADLTGQYVITLLHNVDDEILTPEVAERIINSITLAEEAQKLAP